jgi:hypothetical protein
MDLVIVLNHGFPCLQVKYYNLMSEIYCRHTHKYVQLRKEITILEKKNRIIVCHNTSMNMTQFYDLYQTLSLLSSVGPVSQYN